MSIENIRVSLAFARGPVHGVVTTGNTVLGKLYLVTEMPNPPIDEADLQEGMLALIASMSDPNGGTLATARKHACCRAVIVMLRKLAAFVQMNCDNNIALLLSTGFKAVSTNRASIQLPQPTIISVANGMSGQIVLMANTTPNSRGWLAQSAVIAADGSFGPWVDGPPCNDTRNVRVENLIPGQMYALRLRCNGGSTGCSDWSGVVTHRAA